jgi:hypothetical protein
MTPSKATKHPAEPTARQGERLWKVALTISDPYIGIVTEKDVAEFIVLELKGIVSHVHVDGVSKQP